MPYNPPLSYFLDLALVCTGDYPLLSVPDDTVLVPNPTADKKSWDLPWWNLSQFQAGVSFTSANHGFLYLY